MAAGAAGQQQARIREGLDCRLGQSFGQVALVEDSAAWLQ